MQSDDQVGYAKWLDEGKNNGAANRVTGGIFLVWLVTSYMEVGEISVSAPQRQREVQGRAQSRQEARPRGGTRRRRR